eukprot:CAMPEP_0202896258 /NCGR_PEP_ID=MMETSP1392-20130828/5287_1 /ASSEMBLY_ACC=CAM_ASM_000868 /TAXON_ID=225041 /ORGANISM="Chlamydomonas chlamydogama, Strain SAG 11-48b" /LENGTH=87 /DNA_ID=CAMNT_0049581535 /DNA_START=499 /DNA_END=763 /DNA_ORIENTATION=+
MSWRPAGRTQHASVSGPLRCVEVALAGRPPPLGPLSQQPAQAPPSGSAASNSIARDVPHLQAEVRQRTGHELGPGHQRLDLLLQALT